MVNCSDVGILFYCCDVNNLKRKEVVKMTREELQRIIDSEPYDFLRTDPHLGKHLMFLTIGGSHAYGTNVEGSDVDIRGVALNSKEDLLGLGEFEHHVDTATDTTVFSFNKIVKLLSNGNPNVLELFGNSDDLVISYSPTTKLLMENKKLFLSKNAIKPFGGFVNDLINKSGRLYIDMQGGRYGETDIEKARKMLNKLVMNANRLYLMAFDLFEKGEIITYRSNDIDLLQKFRFGEYDYLEWRAYVLPVYEARMKTACENSSLPDHVNMKLVNELAMTINEQALKVV